MSYSKDEYENKLARLGLPELGHGLYSKVFAIPNTDKVIKVGARDQWPDFAKWATENGYAGTFAPKVFSLKFKEGYYIAVMERLVDTIAETVKTTRSTQSIIYNFLRNSWRDDEQPKEAKEASDWLAFIEKLRWAGLSNDLHDGNVMIRSDGQLVVTDPASDYSSSGKFRIKNAALA